jgi:hypothetical protein
VTSFARPTGQVLLTALLALLLIGAAQARTNSKIIGHATPLKGGLIVYAQASAVAPRSVSIKVTAVPTQTVKIAFSLVCARGVVVKGIEGDPSATPSSGIFSAPTPLLRKLKIPIANPKTCSVNVYSTLSKKGKQTVQILQG